jgi:hypothetical protein
VTRKHLKTVNELYRDWGMTFMYGSRAYNSSDLGQLAEHAWNDAAVYQISTQNAAQGTHFMRKVAFNSTCNDREQINTSPSIDLKPGATGSIAGGVFWVVSGDTHIARSLLIQIEFHQ